MIHIEEPKKWRRCNVCGRDKDVIEIYFRSNFTNQGHIIALCGKCAADLKNLLRERQDY